MTILYVALAFRLCLPQACGLEAAYWVWHRDSVLRNEEAALLRDQGVRTLYWHVGTLNARGDGWLLHGNLSKATPRTDSIAVAPVLRLNPGGSPSLGKAAAVSVAEVLAEAARRAGAAEVQIDFDCPDRRLVEYADFLASCRARLAPTRLSATALAGWSRLPGFEQLQASVDALFPMFYDLQPDSPTRVRAGHALPLADASSLAPQIESWRACRVPWFAGLPNFARVTVFDSSGVSRGHLRAWAWDGVCFNPALILRAQPAPGTILLRAESATVVADTPIAADETITCRIPDLAHLANGIAAAERAGAAGVAFFRLPGTGSQGGWSLPQLGTVLKTRIAGEPELQLRRTRHGLELSNASTSDVAPRLAGNAGSRDRGWQLEVESTAGAIFREASPGEFANVFGHAEPEAVEPKRVPIALAQRLTYWFADLQAGQSRLSGLLQLAPGADATSLRWRIPHSSRNAQWRPLK